MSKSRGQKVARLSLCLLKLGTLVDFLLVSPSLAHPKKALSQRQARMPDP